MKITLRLFVSMCGPLFCLGVFAFSLAAQAGEMVKIHTVRLPDAGVQPQAVVDDRGVIHVIYLAGDPSHSDIFSIESGDGGSFSKPLRVNSQPGSAVAMGTVRGAHLALGKGGRLHVGWMGSSLAEPKSPERGSPMLYSRSTAEGLAFEPQRNVIQSHPGLDGGGSIAADARGNVYLAWHAGERGAGQQSRRVWLAQSHDEGATFAAEEAISGDTGACGCCGMRLLAGGDWIYALYRTADQEINRDMTLLRFNVKTGHKDADPVGKMQIATCVMSTAALATGRRDSVLGAWETNGQIFWSTFSANGALPVPVAVPGRAGGRKHPALAANAAGQVIVVWTEGTGWNKGGSIAWQVYDGVGNPVREAAGQARGLPAWGAPAVVARSNGSFVIVY